MALLWFQRDAWQAPAVMLAGLFAVRGILLIDVPIAYHQLSIGAVWLLAAFLVARLGYVWPAIFLTFSGLSYAALLTIGHYIKFLGITPIVADCFWLLAFASIAVGGGGGKSVDFADDDRAGIGGGAVAPSSLVAAREKKRTDTV